MGRDGGQEGSALPQVWHVRHALLSLLVGLLNKNRLLGSSPRDSDSAVVGRGLKACTANRFQGDAAGQGPLWRSTALGLPVPDAHSVCLSSSFRTYRWHHTRVSPYYGVFLAHDYQSLGAWDTAMSR